MSTKYAMWGVGAVLVGAALYVSQDALAKYEEPPYTVLATDGAIEIRRYAPALVAEVELAGSGNKSRNDGFTILAAYIFGKNKSRSKMEMTAPVLQQSKSEKIGMTVPVLTDEVGVNRMVFFMPSKYSLESIPEPEDPRIQLSVKPGRTVVVIRFSGLSTDSNFDKQLHRLRGFMNTRELTAIGPAARAFYNAPWTLPPLRRNEIMIPIDYPQTTS